MPLAAILSGDFTQLRNSLGHSCVKLLRFHSGVSPRTCNLRSLTTRAGQDQKSQSGKPCNINLSLCDGSVELTKSIDIKKSDLHEFIPINCNNLQQKNSDDKVFDRPVTVLVFDIETTGFSSKYDRIIEIAIRDLFGGKNSTFQTLIKPERIVRNTDIHGISNSMVNRRDVPSFKESIPILLEFVLSRQMDGKPVMFIAHNGRRFDIPFIANEFRRCSTEIPEDWLFLDTLPLARKLVNPDGSKLASSKLEALREHYNIPLVGPAHRAMHDVIVLSHVLQRMTFDLKLTVNDLMGQTFRASEVIKPPT